MKRSLFLLLFISAAALADEPALSNGGMPPGYPATIKVQRVPYGSGVPSPGLTEGYDTAVAVGDGLYSVPGYLPYEPSGLTLYPRVVQVPCQKQGAAWVCAGYSITPALGRGEYLMIQPMLRSN